MTEYKKPLNYKIEVRDGKEEFFIGIGGNIGQKLLQAIKDGRVEGSDLERAIDGIISGRETDIKDKSFRGLLKELDFLNDISKSRTEFYQSAVKILRNLLNAKYVGLHFTDTKYMGVMPNSGKFDEFNFKTNYWVGDDEAKTKIDLLKASGDLNLFDEINEEIVPDSVLHSGRMVKRVLKPGGEEVARLEVYGIGVDEKEANGTLSNFIKIIDSIIKADIRPHKALFYYKQQLEEGRTMQEDETEVVVLQEEILGRGYQPGSEFDKNILKLNEIYNNYRKKFTREYGMFDPEDVFTNAGGKDLDFVKIVAMLTDCAIKNYGVNRLRNGEKTKEAMMFVATYFLTPKYGAEALKKEKSLDKITNTLSIFVENLIRNRKINIPDVITASEIVRLCKEINDKKDSGMHNEADLLEAIIKYSNEVLDTPYSEPHRVKDALDFISVDGYSDEAALIGKIVMSGGKYL